MIGNIKVLGAMASTHLLTWIKRKKYAYGNKKYDVKESRDHIYSMAQTLCNKMIKASGMTINVKGKENLPSEGPVLYVANHKSIFDIVILVSLIKTPSIFIGKKEVEQMPLIKDWFDSMGCIYMDREDKRQSLKSIMQGIDELKNGQCVIIFPEGTRISGDEIKAFKEGSFKLATKSKVPIVPIALHNTYKIFEENKGVRKAVVSVNIGEKIEVEGLDKEGEKALPRYVEGVVKALMEEIIATE